jgi:hypothetical protein
MFAFAFVKNIIDCAQIEIPPKDISAEAKAGL